MDKRRGGPRAGAGRPKKADAKNVGVSLRVSREVKAYLSVVGTGVVEDLIRRSGPFRDWQKSN